MFPRIRLALLLALLLIAIGQTAQIKAQSLGEAAKAARKNKTTSSTTKVYDNENLPRGGTVSVGGGSVSDTTDSGGKEKSGSRSDQGITADTNSRIIELRRRITDLELEFNQLESENRLLKLEWESSKSTQRQCGRISASDIGSVCVEVYTDLKLRHSAYLEKRDAIQTELDKAKRELRDLETANKVEINRTSTPTQDFAAEELRSRTATLKYRIVELEIELQQLEADNRTLKAEWEVNKTSRTYCSGRSCEEQDTDSNRKYRAYEKQRDAKQTELNAARTKLAELQEEARKRGITL